MPTEEKNNKDNNLVQDVILEQQNNCEWKIDEKVQATYTFTTQAGVEISKNAIFVIVGKNKDEKYIFKNVNDHNSVLICPSDITHFSRLSIFFDAIKILRNLIGQMNSAGEIDSLVEDLKAQYDWQNYPDVYEKFINYVEKRKTKLFFDAIKNLQDLIGQMNSVGEIDSLVEDFKAQYDWQNYPDVHEKFIKYVEKRKVKLFLDTIKNLRGVIDKIKSASEIDLVVENLNIQYDGPKYSDNVVYKKFIKYVENQKVKVHKFSIGEEVTCFYDGIWHLGVVTEVDPLKVQRHQDWFAWKFTEVRPIHKKSPIQDHNDAVDRWLCKICMENTINCVYVPCRHICSCSQCAARFHKCPLCRANIKENIIFINEV